MLKSMTGFGRCEAVIGDRKATVEIKSVNHRYCDITVKIPKKLGALESPIRSLIGEYIQRGKVDVFVTYEDNTAGAEMVRYDSALAAEYMKAFRQMQEEFGLAQDIHVSTLSRCPEVLTLEDRAIDEEALWEVIKKAVTGAAQAISQTREKEGENLKTDLISKLDQMMARVLQIEERAPEIIKEYREKLMARVRDMLADTNVDEARIAMETTIYADKLSVDEEIVRLKSHISTMKQELEKGGPVGRKLDFIAQEMNREANTILSKSGDLITSDIAIELKTNIEKVREQIQNIE